MKALILAAGQGSRLRAVSPSKPLATVAGRPLIAHVVDRARQGGVTDFTIVTGHEAEALEHFLAALASELDVPIACVRADPKCANGHSVIAGAARIDGDYLLMMSDHLVDPSIVRLMAGSELAGADLCLAVDRACDGPLIDLEDATRVERDAEGRIVRIGKLIEPFDAIDTGVFRTGPALVEAIRADIGAGGSGSLSAGVQLLADARSAVTLDVTGRFWLDVDDPHTLELAKRWLGGTASQR
jgi:1L-myo-inositol 1-phosphate cytidylyltransferase